MKRIEIGVTHEVIINGDKSWVRLSVAEDIDDGIDDLNSAIDALAAKVNRKLLDVVEATVETINEYDNK